MARTVSIHDNTHILIIKKQTEMLEKHKLNLRISDIIGIIMERHIGELENDLENGISLRKEVSRKNTVS